MLIGTTEIDLEKRRLGSIINQTRMKVDAVKEDVARVDNKLLEKKVEFLDKWSKATGWSKIEFRALRHP